MFIVGMNGVYGHWQSLAKAFWGRGMLARATG